MEHTNTLCGQNVRVFIAIQTVNKHVCTYYNKTRHLGRPKRFNVTIDADSKNRKIYNILCWLRANQYAEQCKIEGLTTQVN